MPAVLLALLIYIIKNGGPTLNIRSAEPAVVKMETPLTVHFAPEDRDLMVSVTKTAENHAKLDERSREHRRTVRRIETVLHRHGNVLQVLADRNKLDLSGLVAWKDSPLDIAKTDEDSDEPTPDTLLRR
jgi:hypothetical protein